VTGPQADSAADTGFDENAWDRRSRNRSPSARWIGWRLRALVVAALLGCLAVFILLRAMAVAPMLDARLQYSGGNVVLMTDVSPPVAIVALVDAQGRREPIDGLLLQRSARWLATDAERAGHARQHDALAAALATGTVALVDAAGTVHRAAAIPRGAAGLGWLFWLLSTLALLLYLVTMVVLLARPEARNVLFAAMAIAQAGNLLFVAALSTPGLGWPGGVMGVEHDLRTAFDLVTAAALVHVTNLHPRALPRGKERALAGWAVAATVWLLVTQGWVSHTWWWTQVALVAGAALTTAQLAWMQRRQPHPLALQLLRFCAVAGGTLVLLTLIVSAIDPVFEAHGQAIEVASMVWVVFLSVMLLMLPFLARTQQLMREFSLLAGVSTVATALDLLFVAVFSLGNFASLTLALFVSLAAYVGVRQWLLARVTSRERLTTERMFEHLYRMAREVQAQPGRAGEQLARLLRELFEPINVHQVPRYTRRARVVADGVSLVVPIPELHAGVADAPGAIVLGFADRGRRLFNEDDARLADRIVELIARAVAYDQAVERGRSEERVRIAQDLHDDIGARLLTLMYQAPTPEMEDYLRNTLKDLKTLTRGLAAPSHALSHAVAEWKSDITQRVTAADCHLGWSFAYESDFELSVVQWSALTRVLRELVSNALAHAQASRIDIQASIGNGTLALSVIDDGSGRAPEAWSHGLGLGGVRKRVKQMGGDVSWHENGARGIVCRVTVPGFAPD
jgi:signal transduction histidine kinase